jgi:hypothetical protein
MLVAASPAETPNLILSVQVVPGTVSAGRPALAVAIFRNTGRTDLPHVVVSLHLPPGMTVKDAGDCTAVSGSVTDVDCTLGDVTAGTTMRANVTAQVAKNLGKATSLHVQFALRVGPGRPSPILTGASAQVLASSDASHRGSCEVHPTALSASLNRQITSLPAPPTVDPSIKVPCTPLSVAVSPKPEGQGFKTNIASVGLPKLVHPAIVKLTFANETLPDEKWIDNVPAGRHPAFDNPNPLWLWFPSGAKRVVPRCIKSAAGPTFPTGWNSCVIKVIATDPYGDLDQGYITLLVQGQGFGDPRYLG